MRNDILNQTNANAKQNENREIESTVSKHHLLTLGTIRNIVLLYYFFTEISFAFILNALHLFPIHKPILL